MAEGARLESVFRGNSNVGSNPTLSANLSARFITLKTQYLSAKSSARVTGDALGVFGVMGPDICLSRASMIDLPLCGHKSKSK